MREEGFWGFFLSICSVTISPISLLNNSRSVITCVNSSSLLVAKTLTYLLNILCFCCCPVVILCVHIWLL